MDCSNDKSTFILLQMPLLQSTSDNQYTKKLIPESVGRCLNVTSSFAHSLTFTWLHHPVIRVPLTPTWYLQPAAILGIAAGWWQLLPLPLAAMGHQANSTRFHSRWFKLSLTHSFLTTLLRWWWCHWCLQ